MSKLIKCKSCSNEIATKAKTCPGCGAKNKKPVYKRAWFIILAAILVIGVVGSMGEDDTAKKEDSTPADNQVAITPNEDQDIQEEKEDENVPTEYKTALKKAKTYSDTMYMSKVGLYEQLTSEYGEKYTEEAAQYAIDNIETDWNENALKKAKSYSSTMHMSKAGIYDQLISEYGERFTPEEAQYAIDNVQADWNENALKKAKTYQDSMAMSPSAIYDQLISEYGEKFTPEEAQYAIDNLQ